jgi:restriction endonuclease S subunit
MPKISNKDIEEVEVRIPPIELQRKFVLLMQRFQGLTEKQQLSTQEIDELFVSVIRQAFRGELELSQRDVLYSDIVNPTLDSHTKQ